MRSYDWSGRRDRLGAGRLIKLKKNMPKSRRNSRFATKLLPNAVEKLSSHPGYWFWTRLRSSTLVPIRQTGPSNKLTKYALNLNFSILILIFVALLDLIIIELNHFEWNFVSISSFSSPKYFFVIQYYSHSKIRTWCRCTSTPQAYSNLSRYTLFRMRFWAKF